MALFEQQQAERGHLLHHKDHTGEAFTTDSEDSSEENFHSIGPDVWSTKGQANISFQTADKETYFSLDPQATKAHRDNTSITSDEDTFFSLEQSILTPQTLQSYIQQDDGGGEIASGDDCAWDSGNGFPLDIQKVMREFQSLYSKVIELRNTNRKVLKNLNEEERLQQKGKERTQHATKEMESHLKILEERTQAREEKLKHLRSSLTTISQNVDKLEILVMKQNNSRAKGAVTTENHLSDIRITHTGNKESTWNIDKEHGASNSLPDMTENEKQDTISNIWRNDNGLKCRKTINEEDNRVKLLQRRNRIRKTKRSKLKDRYKNEVAEKEANIKRVSLDLPINKGDRTRSDTHQQSANKRERPRSDKQQSKSNLSKKKIDPVSRLKDPFVVIRGQETVQIIPQEKWVDWANAAMQEGKRERRPTGKGPDTILLLDISASMAGKPFEEMKCIAKQYLQDFQDSWNIEYVGRPIGIWTSERKGTLKPGLTTPFYKYLLPVSDIERTSGDVPENVALVTFGHQTRIVRHTCNDYRGLAHDIDTLRVGGPSPMGGGLYMAVAAAVNAYSPSVCGVKVHPRIILISDGNATSDTIVAGPDVQLPTVSMDEVHLRLLQCASEADRRNIRIYCIPVGNPEMMHLQGITATTNGKIYQKEQIGRLSRMYKNMCLAFKLKSMHSVENEIVFRMMVQMFAFTENIQTDDLEDIIAYAKDQNYGKGNEDNGMHKEFDENLPPIGTRVRRGPGWSYDDQDRNGPGTVVGHEVGGAVWVEWDKARPNVYHCGVAGPLDIVVVDEPRVLKDELIAVGCCVKRGKDWRYRNDDGGVGSVGVVFIVNKDATVSVRWPNRNMKKYKYGYKGYFEVELCDPPKTHVTRGARASSEANTQVEKDDQHYIIDTTLSSISVEEMNRKNASLSDILFKSGPKHILEQDNSDQSSITSGSDFEACENDNVIPETDSESDEQSLELKSSQELRFDNSTETVEIKNTESTGKGRNDMRREDNNDVRYTYKWEYKDSEGNWIPYPVDVMLKIEQTFNRLPNGTTVIHMDGSIYRILFSKWLQVNTTTKEVSDIRRSDLAQ